MIETYPKFLPFEKELFVNKGNEISIRIEYEGIPEPTLEWLHETKSITKSIKIEKYCSTYQIPKAESNDSGTYNLRLKNNCGEVEASFKLLVRGKLIILLKHILFSA